MRGLLVAGVSVAALAGSVTAAGAHVAICLGPEEVQTPVNPVFIVRKWDRYRSARARGEATSRDGKELETRITSLDTFWSRVEVVAPRGSEFSFQPSSRRYQPSSSWTGVRQAPRVTQIRELDGRGFHVRADVASHQALRVEWSYTPDDLEPKKHGLLIVGPPRCGGIGSDFVIPAARHAEIVYMRLVPLLLDGTSGPAWEGWIHRDPQTQQAYVGQGPPPATSGRPITRCDTSQQWTVGENPTFTFHDRYRLFRATTRDGRPLPTNVDDGLGYTRVTVTASEGTTFQLEAIPTGIECPLAVSVARHTIGSRVLVRSMTVIDDTHLSVRVAPSPGVSRLRVGTRHTIDSTGSPIIDGNVVVALNHAVWRLEAEYATAGQSGFWLSAFDRGFEGPSCYIGIARDSATGNITATGALGPSGEPSCFDAVVVDTNVVDDAGAARSSIASQRHHCAGDSSASFIAIFLCFLAAAGLQRRFCANAL